MDEFVYRGPYGYIEESNYNSISNAASTGKNNTDKEQSEEIANLNEAVAATAEAVAENTNNIETLQSDVQEIKDAGYQTEDDVKTAIAEVVDGAPEALDTLKEIAEKLSDNDDAVANLVNSVSEAKSAADAADAKADAVKEELTAEVEKKADAETLDETNAAVAALSDRVDAIEVPSLDGYATQDWVNEQGFLKEHQDISDLATKEEVNNEVNRATAKEAELEESLEKKVEWTESTVGRNHIVLKNHDSILGTATDGSTYNVAMVSKWDVADFGSAQLHANLNSKDGIVTINDDKAVATKDEVEAVETKVDAIDLTPYAKSEEVNAELANKANASDLSALNTTVEELSSKVEEKALQSDLEAEVARAEAKEAELVAKDEAQDAEIAKKVDWVESTPGRNHIVLKNHDSVLGTATDGGTYNLAMVSKWDVADFGSAQLHANLNSKDGSVTINDDKVVATKDEVEAVDAKVNAIDLTPFAKTEDMNAAVETLNAKDAELEAAIPTAAAQAVAQVVANAPEDLDTLKEVADYIASDKTKAAEIETKLADLEAKDAELVSKDEAQDAIINGKVDRDMNGANGKALIFNESDGGGAKFEHNDGTWSFAGVNDGGENGIAGQLYVVKKNASNKMEGTRIDMTKGAMYYTVGDASAAERMVADNEIAVKGDVKAVNDKVDALEIPSIEGLAKSADVTAEIASAVSVLNTKDEAQDAEIALKADTDKVYTKEDVDNTLEGYVPVEQYNELKARLDNLEIMLSVYNAEREAQMDEIISNMSSDNKEVVTETLMESIVVPETTVAYTITAPLTDNSTVELTSPKYMTLINTSKEPVSTTISHEYAEGETTAATTVYLVGDFNTLTIENVSPSVKSGYDAASVKNVVIPETNVKNLSLSLDFQDGATITNNSDKDITITDKNDSAIALTVVAPNSTVTLSSGQFTTLNAEVSDNTLIIKKNVHIANLNLAKGNAIVEVARAEEVAGIVENYTVADGYTLSHRIYHITNENTGKLGGVGEMILDEDITTTSSLVSPLAPAWDSVWNLNGHNISFVKETPRDTDCVAMMRYSSMLEVNGEGEVYTPNTYGLWASGTNAKIVVNSGKFTANTHVLYCEQGTIEVNGGEFHMANDDAAKDDNGNYRFLLNCLDKNYNNGTAKIIVKGGKFYDFDPANCAAEGVGTNFVADGYESVASTETIDGVEHKVYTVQKSA